MDRRFLLVGFWMIFAGQAAAAEQGRTGEQIYRQRCASCHGASGEGIKEHYPHALTGDRSASALAELIEATMPEDDPQQCVGDDARRVAAYVYEAFYSPAARARHKPARIELARLTVGQYQNAVSDLVGSFRGAAHWDERRGLRGEYFKSRRFRNEDRVLERLDAEVRFDFGTSSPLPEKIKAEEFAIRWRGSVFARQTGLYEFVVKTENGARLWVNDTERPLIDVWVKSGSQNEHRASIHLLGGRAYPLRLEFFKLKEKTASVALEWEPPHAIQEPIPERNLLSGDVPETFVVTTPFPPDDRNTGYERGTSISKAWDQAVTAAAIEAAEYVVAHLRELPGAAGEADRRRQLRELCRRFAQRAFRRPFTDEQEQLYIGRQFDGAPDLETAVKRVVLLVLKSPRFLYREIGGKGDGYDVASRLSFGLWDSLPDEPLLEAAAAGRLATRDQVARQAERMLADPRARAKLREFFLQWLRVDQHPDLAKDRRRFAEFTPAVASDLRTSLELFLEEVVGSERFDFRQVLLTDSMYLNGRLAQFYGADLPADAPFQKAPLDRGLRAGVLSHPYLMASFAYTADSSPIHRGVFLARSVLGRSLRPPPEAVAPLAPDLHPDLTTRQRVALQTEPESCQSCHAMINPLGFALEHFDAAGRYRREEQGRPIDASGAYQTLAGPKVTYDGARQLAEFLAASEETHVAFVEQLFHHLVKQPVRAFGPQTLPDLCAKFAAHDCEIRALIVEIMAASALPQEK